MTLPQKGSIMLLALVFGAIFFTVLTGLSGYVLSENNFELAKQAQGQALSIAESGLEYYHWHLEHFPKDLQNGTGTAGPYAIPYNDPQGGQVGTYTLDITANQSCGQTTSVDIKSTGTPRDYPNISRTLIARYAKPTVAQYAYIVNASVWAGSSRIINGSYHSNGGVRMDGTANAPVTSSLSTWTCTGSFGCTPNKTVNGVFGSGTNQSFWKYPTPQVSFTSIAANFSPLKSIAQTQGLYFPRISSGTGGVSYHEGYHFTFNGDGTVTVQKVTKTYALYSVSISNSSKWTLDYTLIRKQALLGTYTIPTNCALIYVSDNVWVDGIVSRKVTLVSADTVDTGVKTDAVLKGNITYKSSAAGLTLISQGDVLIAPDSPNDMTVSGMFIAQSGAFGRNLYPCIYPSYDIKNSLTIIGSVVSNKRVGTSWGYSIWWLCGYNQFSGYKNRVSSSDRSQYANPPPFTPTISSEYKFINWRQK